MSQTLGFQKRIEVAPFGRLSRGMLFYLQPELIVPGATPNPSAPVEFDPQTNGTVSFYVSTDIRPMGGVTIQAEVFRSYLMRAGLYVWDGITSKSFGMAVDNGGLNSGVESYNNTLNPIHVAATATFENTYMPLKLDVQAGFMRMFSEGNLVDQRQAIAFNSTGEMYPVFVTDSDSLTQVGGNSYTTKYRKMLVCKNNRLTLTGFPPYGSVSFTLDGGAPVTLNVDGNGDASYDFGARAFPCVAIVSAYDAPNATGTIKGLFRIQDMCGGDIIGATRTTLQPYPFTPKSITRLGLWLAPENIPVAGGAAMVTGWPDASGNARHLAKPAAIAAPTKIDAAYNGRAVARFDGSGQLLFNDDNALRPASFTLAVALAFSAVTTGAKGLLSIITNATQGININQNGGAGAEAIYANDNGVTGPGYYPTTFGAGVTMHVLFIEYNAITGTLRTYLNGNATPTIDVIKGVTWPITDPCFALGAFYSDAGAVGSALFSAGDIGEVLLYSKVLRAPDRARLATYLTSRWL